MAEHTMGAKAETEAGALGKKTQEKGKKSLIQKLAGNLAVRLALAGTALGGGVYSAYQEIPAVHRTVDKAIETVRGEVPSTFDNNAGRTKFGEKNITKITAEEAGIRGLLEPTIKIDNTGVVTVTTLLPGIFPLSIPVTQIDSKNDKGNAEKAPFATKFFTMPEGFQLFVPKGTYYALFKGQLEANQDPNLVYTIMTFFYDPVSNKSIGIAYETKGFVPADGEKTFDRKVYNQLYNPAGGGNFRDLPLSDGVTPIARPASPNQGLYSHLSSISGSDESNLSLNSFDKVKWENHVDPNQKLLVVSSK